jgi:hypothetical protein
MYNPSIDNLTVFAPASFSWTFSWTFSSSCKVLVSVAYWVFSRRFSFSFSFSFSCEKENSFSFSRAITHGKNNGSASQAIFYLGKRGGHALYINTCLRRFPGWCRNVCTSHTRDAVNGLCTCFSSSLYTVFYTTSWPGSLCFELPSYKHCSQRIFSLL